MKNILYIISLICIVGMVNAMPSGSNYVINDTDGILKYGDSYQFNITISDIINEISGNVTSCNINNIPMVGPSGNGTGLWQINTTINGFSPDLADNCTYIDVSVNCTLTNTSTFITTNSSWTGLPCVESCNVTLSSATATVDTLTMSVNNSLASATEIWMIPQSYNTSHGQCNFNISNIEKATIQNVTVNLTSSTPYCKITLERDTTDTGTMVTQVCARLSITQPSSIPAVAIGALTIILIFSHIIATKTST